MDLYLKSDGKYVRQEITQDEYLQWFKENTNEKGDVTEDCLLYKDADLTINTDKSVTFVMSDDSLDRDFERFDTTGWDLKTYKKNPVLLWSHDRTIPAIGVMEKTRVKDNRLIGNPAFDLDDPLAVKIAAKVQKRVLRSGSVGFFPSKIEFNDDDKDPCRLTYLKQELREFSICNVPANPNAVVVEDGKAIEPKTHSTGHMKYEYRSGDEDQKKKALKEIPSWAQQQAGRYASPDKDQMNILSSVVTIDDWNAVKEQVEEMAIEIETIKNMQMKMAETVVKEDRNYYADLLETKKPQKSGLKELLKQRRALR